MELVSTPLNMRMHRISESKQKLNYLSEVLRPLTHLRNRQDNVQGLDEFARFQEAFNTQSREGIDESLRDMDECLDDLYERLQGQGSAQTGPVQRSFLKASYLFSQVLLNQGYLSEAFETMQRAVEILKDCPVPKEIREYAVELGHAKARALSIMVMRPPLICAEAARRELWDHCLWGNMMLRTDFMETVDESTEVKKHMLDDRADLDEALLWEPPLPGEIAQEVVPEPKPEPEPEETPPVEDERPVLTDAPKMVTPEILVNKYDKHSDDDLDDAFILTADDPEAFLIGSATVPLQQRLTRSMGSYEDMRLLEADAIDFEFDPKPISPTLRPPSPRMKKVISRKASPV